MAALAGQSGRVTDLFDADLDSTSGNNAGGYRSARWTPSTGDTDCPAGSAGGWIGGWTGGGQPADPWRRVLNV